MIFFLTISLTLKIIFQSSPCDESGNYEVKLDKSSNYIIYSISEKVVGEFFRIFWGLLHSDILFGAPLGSDIIGIDF